MISWLKYPENKPKECALCLIRTDSFGYLQCVYKGGIFKDDRLYHCSVTHFTEINPPLNDNDNDNLEKVPGK